MTLSKHTIGDLIETYNVKCNIPNLTIYDVSGINREKEFFSPTVQVGSDTSNYKEVPVSYFACNLMHVGRDFVIPIAYNNSDEKIIVSPAYNVFRVSSELIIKEYFYMYLKKLDFDRYAAFCTDSSVRDGLEWSRFCDIEIDVPSLEEQQKVVDVYLAMVENQKVYEKGIDDLKLTCDAYIGDLRKKYPLQKIGFFLEEKQERNIDLLYSSRGISLEKKFITSKRSSNSYENYKVVHKNNFAFRPVLDNLDSSFTIALNNEDTCSVSPAYTVFEVDEDKIISKYLLLWFSRKETERWLAYNAWGSARNTIELNEIGNLEIPVPDLTIQKAVVEIFEVYESRKRINDILNERINNICPVLIQGSIS